ncbi:DUF4276 family protein [Croceicoccus sp. BE223]|uniref:DUF4276 family protein n=1 Tax=Croceicoccus sp. BE223 TaxID=2817716 RepID=UPI002865F403|nr:hypothetical protein [Croceicoccus sp. BE223]
MTRLLVHVEGQTEETFVNVVLAPHLYNLGYKSVGARLLGNARNRSRRGGIKSWDVVYSDVSRHLKEDTECFATTMVDYYALPNTWPGRNSVGNPSEKSVSIRTALSADFETRSNIVGRFLPFVMMHEFEALLFSDCSTFAHSLGFASKAPQLQEIRSQFETPEHINDSPETAPSKRVQAIINNYDKVLFGNIAASEIGLQTICEQCPSFGAWIYSLELLAP